MSKKSQLKRKRNKRKARKAVSRKSRPACGLCGATENLMRTECCNEWICDDEDEYVLFSYERNSCSRNHGRYTLCGYHWTEGHDGNWMTCPHCKSDFEGDLEMYVYYGTNEYNFKMLPNPPKFEPTKCTECSEIIDKSMGGYSEGSDGVFCMKCTAKRFGRF